MIRIFLTGDNHIGLKYSNYEQGQKIAEYRIKALEYMVEKANDIGCNIFVVAGDLFHARNGNSKRDVLQVVDYLSHFDGQVLVLPGNHDYYSESQDANKNVWDYFEEAITYKGNILLMTEYRPYNLLIGDEKIIIYPALCKTKTFQHGENNLEWIVKENIKPDSTYRIGIAHGAVEGETIDNEGNYFLMTRRELESIPVDVWLIGHTHVPFPKIELEKYINDTRIFNAGTHVQTDVSCNTDGNCFVIEIENGDSLKKVQAKRLVSGSIHFYRKKIFVQSEKSLADVLETELKSLPNESIVDLILSGSVTEEDYKNRRYIINNALSRFLDKKVINDNALDPIITEERIKSEYPETSFSAQLLLRLLDEPKEAQLVYDLLKECE